MVPPHLRAEEPARIYAWRSRDPSIWTTISPADIASALELLTLEAWHTCWSAEFQDADGSLSSASQDLDCDGTSLSNKMASPTIA